MPPPKKVVFNPFHTRCRARSVDPADPLRDEDVGPGEFRDTSVTFSNSGQKCEANLTLQFRCTVKIVRGDSIVFRLAGFKGTNAGVFTLEKRPHPENKEYHMHFHAFWSGENPPKGTAPAQTITLQCRKAIEQNTLVIVGVPDCVHIGLPDKLAANSPKLKIEGAVKHAAGGKIPKAPVMACGEVKKRPVEEDIAELQNLLKDYSAAAGLDEEDELRHITEELSVQEVDQIWEAAQNQSELKLGLQFRLETAAFRNYEEHAPLAKMLTENYRAASKKKVPLALHRELAANLGVKVGAILILEDALYALHGCHYPELSRSAVLVLRLYTCESHDIARMLGLTSAVCIHRDINSAMRTLDNSMLAKWTHFLATLMTCCGKLTHIAPEVIPVLYRGVRELPAEAIQQLLALKKDDWYLFPNFTSYVTEAKYQDEMFSAPESAVLFEIHGAVDGVEIGDVSQYPEDREWILPMFSSFSVVSVEALPDKNQLIRLVLRMRGSLAGALRDEQFPEEQRSLSSVVITKARAESMLASEKTLFLTKMIYANVRLETVKVQQPSEAMREVYLDKYADVKRGSVARQRIEEGTVKWQQCTNEAALGTDGLMRQATWEPFNKKIATAVETLFLKTTRTAKQFTAEGLTLDFAAYTADNGKVVRRIRRLIGRYITHPFTS